MRRTSKIIFELRESLFEEFLYLLEDIKRIEEDIARIRDLLNRKLMELTENIKYVED